MAQSGESTPRDHQPPPPSSVAPPTPTHGDAPGLLTGIQARIGLAIAASRGVAASIASVSQQPPIASTNVSHPSAVSHFPQQSFSSFTSLGTLGNLGSLGSLGTLGNLSMGFASPRTSTVSPTTGVAPGTPARLNINDADDAPRARSLDIPSSFAPAELLNIEDLQLQPPSPALASTPPTTSSSAPPRMPPSLHSRILSSDQRQSSFSSVSSFGSIAPTSYPSTLSTTPVPPSIDLLTGDVLHPAIPNNTHRPLVPDSTTSPSTSPTRQSSPERSGILSSFFGASNSPSNTSEPAPVAFSSYSASSTASPSIGRDATPAATHVPFEGTNLSLIEVQERLARQRKFESRFTDLARAYKALKSKQQQIESLIQAYTPVQSFSRPDEFALLQSYLHSARQNEHAAAEVTKLLRQIQEIKQSHEEESRTNSDMFGVMQKRLVDREEEINRLKHRLHKLESGGATPTEGSATPGRDTPSIAAGAVTPASQNGTSASVTTEKGMDSLTLKLKVRELASALKKVTDQRNRALDHIRTLENGTKSSEGAHTLIRRDSVASSSGEPIAHGLAAEDAEPASTDAARQSISSPYETPVHSMTDLNLHARIHELEEQSRSWKSNYENESNVSASLKMRVQSLCDENDRAIDRVTELEETQRKLDIQIEQQSSQIKAMTDDLAGQVDENEKLKAQIKELTRPGGHHSSFEQIRQEARERNAGLESRLRTVQQKLLQAEASRNALEAQLKERTEQLEKFEAELFETRGTASLQTASKPDRCSVCLNVPDGTCDDAGVAVTEHKALVESLEQEKHALEHDLGAARADLDRANILLKEHTEKIEVLEQELQTAVSRANALEKDANQSADAVRVSESKAANLANQLADVQDQLTQERAQLNEKQEQIAELSKHFASSETDHARAIETVHKEVADARAELHALQSRITDDHAKLVKDHEAHTERMTKKFDEARQQHQQRMAVVETELSARMDEIERLREEVRQVQAISKAAAQRSQTLETELAEKVSELQESRRAADELRGELDALQKTTQDKMTSLESDIAQHVGTIAGLRAKLNHTQHDIKAQIETNEHGLREKAARIESLELQVEGLRRQLEGTAVDTDSTRLVELESALVEERARTAEAQKRSETRQRELEEKEAALTQAISNLEAATTALQTSQSETQSLSTQLTQHMKQHDALIRERDVFKHRVQSMQASTEHHLTQIASLEKEVADGESNRNQLQRLINGLKSKTRELMTLQSDLKTRYDDVVGEVEQGRETVQQLKSRLEENGVLVQELQKDKCVVELDLADAQRQVDDYGKQMRVAADAAAAELTALRIQLDSAVDEKKVLQAKIADLEAGVASISQQQSVAINTDLEPLHKEIGALNQRLMTTKAELDRVKKDRTAFETEAKNAQANATRLETELATLHQELTQADNKIIDLTQKLSTAKTASTESFELASRAATAETQLRQALSDLQTKSAALSETEQKLIQTQRIASEEEERKNKSIQLLRHSKTRILKLESDLKTKMAEVQVSRQELVESVQRVRDFEMQVKEQQDHVEEIRRLRHQLSSESQRVEQQVTQARAAALKADERERSARAETETIREMLVNLQNDVFTWTLQSQDYESRIETLDQELETSKRLFQTKSIENDQMKVRVSELEVRLFEATQEAVKRREDVDAQRREGRESARVAADRLRDIHRLERELSDAKRALSAAEQATEQRTLETHSRAQELDAARDAAREAAERAEAAAIDVSRSERVLSELRASLAETREAHQRLVSEREADALAWRMKETQLKNLNRALKDEVRKLNRNALSSSSSSSLGAPESSGELSPRVSVAELRDGAVSPHSVQSPRTQRPSSMIAGSSSAAAATSTAPGHTSSSTHAANTSTTTRTSLSSTPTQHSMTAMQLHANTVSPLGQHRPSDTSFQPNTPSSSSSLIGISITPTRSTQSQHQSSQRSSLQRRDSHTPLPEPNPEYIKHVILKFIESRRDQRNQLLHVLAMLLKFSPDELGRAQRLV